MSNKNKRGFAGVITLVVVVLIALIFAITFLNGLWFKIPNISGQPASEGKADVGTQLGGLQDQLKQVGDAHNQEIEAAMKLSK